MLLKTFSQLQLINPKFPLLKRQTQNGSWANICCVCLYREELSSPQDQKNAVNKIF